MDISFFLRGCALGFSIAAVVGPIGMLCIQRSLHRGFVPGLVTGLGAATADGVYGGIAAFGLTIISTVLVGQQVWIRLLGGLFLLYLGIRTMLTPPRGKVARADGSGLVGLYISTFLLTLTNPLTILSFATIFAGLGVGTGGQNIPVAALVTLGVFSGSACWWLLLLGWINRRACVALRGFGLWAIVSVIR